MRRFLIHIFVIAGIFLAFAFDLFEIFTSKITAAVTFVLIIALFVIAWKKVGSPFGNKGEKND